MNHFNASVIIVLLVLASTLFAVEDDIDSKINRLKTEISELRLKAMRKELNTDPMIHGSWKQSVQDVAEAEVYEDLVEEKEKELQQLLQIKNR